MRWIQDWHGSAGRLEILERQHSRRQVLARRLEDKPFSCEVAYPCIHSGKSDVGMAARRTCFASAGRNRHCPYRYRYACWCTCLPQWLCGSASGERTGMAFLVAGGVSSLPAAIAVWALVRKEVFFLYLGLALIGSFTIGLGFQLWASF